MTCFWHTTIGLLQRRVAFILSALIPGALLLGACQRADSANRLGVEVIALSDGIAGGPGALVSAIYPCTCAKDAGLQLGDIIHSVGNQAVDAETLTTTLGKLPLHETITLGVRRDNRRVQLRAKLDTHDMTSRARAVPYSGLQRWNDVPGSLVVDCILPGSPLDIAGVKRGDVVERIGGSLVTLASFQDVLAETGFDTQTVLQVRRGETLISIPVKLGDFDVVPERLEVIGIGDSVETVERVLDVEKIRLDNCNGTEVRDSRRALSRKKTSKFTLGASADLNAYGLLPMLLAEGKIKSHFDYDESNEITESKEEVMRASPATIANYVVKWYEVSSSGVVTIGAGDRRHTVPFTFTRQFRGEIESLPATPCTRATL